MAHSPKSNRPDQDKQTPVRIRRDCDGEGNIRFYYIERNTDQMKLSPFGFDRDGKNTQEFPYVGAAIARASELNFNVTNLAAMIEIPA